MTSGDSRERGYGFICVVIRGGDVNKHKSLSITTCKYTQNTQSDILLSSYLISHIDRMERQCLAGQQLPKRDPVSAAWSDKENNYSWLARVSRATLSL